jgi:predicted membrane protein
MEARLNDETVPIAVTKLIVGLFFAALGLLLTAGNLRLLPVDEYLRYWPAFIIVIGVLKLADPRQRMVGGIVTAVGASLLAFSAGWVHFTIFDLWPLVLIGMGVAMVSRSFGFRWPAATNASGKNVAAIFNVRKLAPTTADFSGMNIVAIMGGCELDLTQADIAHSPAIIEIFAFWGGVEIFIPPHWEVIGEVVPIMGGFEVTTSPMGRPDRQLIVRGAVIMAGTEVKRRGNGR